jgi:hypothetical protein
MERYGALSPQAAYMAKEHRRTRELQKSHQALQRTVDELLNWAVANRGRKGSEFVACWTYPNGEFPRVLIEAQEALVEAARYN